MKNKWKYMLGMLVICCLVLVGCGKSSTSNHNSQSNSTSQNTSKQSNNKQSSQLWNSSKDQQLADFINQWAPTMGQSYTKYDGQHDLRNKAGEYYPKDLSHDNVNGSKASIGWAPSGKGSYEYNVVAIYNYDRPGNAATHITYAFAFHNGQPVALVDQSTNGGANWTPTKNTDVQSNFERIARGQKSSGDQSDHGSSESSAKSNSSSQQSTPKINSAQDALNYLKQQKGDGDYSIDHGTFGMSDNPYATITDHSTDTTYYVYQNGKIEER